MDNGKGFDLSEIASRPEGGAGIKSMQKRLAMIGTNFKLESGIGKGTRILAELTMP